MRKSGQSLLIGALLLLSGYSQAALISWESAINSVAKDEVFTLDIIGTDFAGIVDGGGIDFSFDASVLNVLSVSVNQSFWDFSANAGVIDNAAGTVNGISMNAWVTSVTGEFTVASVQFQAVGDYALSSELVLSEYGFNPWASGGSRVDPVYASAAVTIVPVPATVWLFVSGLIGLTGFLRRKFY